MTAIGAHDGLRNHTSAAIWAVAGLILVYGGVVAMNELSQPPDKERAQDRTQMEIQKRPEPPPPKKEVQKPPPEPRTSPRNPPPAPLEGLGSALSGVDFGLPDFSFSSLGKPSGKLLGDTRDITMTGDSVDVPPRPYRRPQLTYPREAKQKGLEGYVTLSLLIDKEGQVVKARVLVDETALNGVKDWVFYPAQYQGEPVRVWARQKVRFERG